MAEQLPARAKLRFAVDAGIGLAVYLALTVATLGPSAASELLGVHSALASLGDASPSMPLFIASKVPAASSVELRSHFYVLAAVFSALYALNFAFARHLRRAHVSAQNRGQALPGAPNFGQHSQE